MQSVASLSPQILAAFPIFSRFQWKESSFGPDKNANMTGAVARNAYMPAFWFQGLNKFQANEDIFEWADLLESVEASGDNFTMAYLGAGYGRWIVNAALAARQKRRPYGLSRLKQNRCMPHGCRSICKKMASAQANAMFLIAL